METLADLFVSNRREVNYDAMYLQSCLEQQSPNHQLNSKARVLRIAKILRILKIIRILKAVKVVE